MFEKSKRDHKEIESVFSLINIIFLLIVFFIVAGHVSDDNFEVNPPKANDSNALNVTQDCTIYVSNNTAIYDGQEILNKPDIIQKISNNCGHKTLLIADKDINAIQIITVMDKINSYFEQIKLLVMSEK